MVLVIITTGAVGALQCVTGTCVDIDMTGEVAGGPLTAMGASIVAAGGEETGTLLSPPSNLIEAAADPGCEASPLMRAASSAFCHAVDTSSSQAGARWVSSV
jgi:hypothetical protein